MTGIDYGANVRIPASLTDVSNVEDDAQEWPDFRFEAADGAEYVINLDSELDIDTSVLNVDVRVTVNGETANAQWVDRKLTGPHHLVSQLHADNERSRNMFLGRPATETLFITDLIHASYRTVTRRDWTRSGVLATRYADTHDDQYL